MRPVPSITARIFFNAYFWGWCRLIKQSMAPVRRAVHTSPLHWWYDRSFHYQTSGYEVSNRLMRLSPARISRIWFIMEFNANESIYKTITKIAIVFNWQVFFLWNILHWICIRNFTSFPFKDIKLNTNALKTREILVQLTYILLTSFPSFSFANFDTNVISNQYDITHSFIRSTCGNRLQSVWQTESGFNRRQARWKHERSGTTATIK